MHKNQSQSATGRSALELDIGFLPQRATSHSQPLAWGPGARRESLIDEERPQEQPKAQGSGNLKVRGIQKALGYNEHRCRLCPRSYKQRKDLNRHMRKQHPDEWAAEQKRQQE